MWPVKWILWRVPWFKEAEKHCITSDINMNNYNKNITQIVGSLYKHNSSVKDWLSTTTGMQNDG